MAGRYSLEREVGRGGMGVVFLARDVALERPVAIKLLPRHLARDDESRERFLREARTAAQLMHPNIVPIHAVEAQGDLVFFVMAFVDGETLAERVRRTGVLKPADAIKIMQEVAWALGYAHGRGIVHRDIKPDNILIEHASGRAMVADFGIARVENRNTLSGEGMLMGTVQYMSPEQAGVEELDGRSDVFSLGATMYFGLTGTSPVEAPSIPAMLARLMSEPVTSIATLRPEMPAAFVTAVMTCLAKHRDDRFASADLLAAALQVALPHAGGTRPEVRAFIREIHSAKMFLIAAVLGAPVLVMLILADIVPQRTWPGVLAVVAVGFFMFLAVVLGMFLQAHRSGIAREELVDGITDELDDMQEGIKRAMASNANTAGAMLVIGGLGMVMGVVIAFLGARTARLDLHAERGWVWYFPFVIAAVNIGYGVAIFSTVRRGRPLPKWMRNDKGKGGDLFNAWPLRLVRSLASSWIVRKFFSGRPHDVRARPSALPTATLLFNRVQELIGAMPSAMQARLSDVIPVATNLERAISALRARVERIDMAIAELPAASAARTEFAVARTTAVGQLEQCVQGLELIRTDCLRLSAGLIAADGVTADLEKVQALSRVIDAELHGVDEVRKLRA